LGGEKNIVSAGEYREYRFAKHEKSFDKEIVISIPYVDEDQDGFVDGRNIDELTLDAYWFNEEAEKWKLLSDVLVFPQENLVTIKTNHFSLFGIAGEERGNGEESDNEVNCFIATATFGTPLSKDVKVLCALRDRYLLKSETGKRLVNLYYNVSPPIARFLKDRPLSRAVVRYHLKFLVYLTRFVL